MSYRTLSEMQRDSDLIERITACAATLKHPTPDSFARPNMWGFVTSPGWAEKYTASNNPKRGADENAVTDAMILAEVEKIIAAENAPPATAPEAPTSPAE